MEDWRVGEQINWSHYVAVCYLRLRSSTESERLQMKPESELCEMAPAPKDSWAEHSSQSYQITQPHLFSEEADRRNDASLIIPLAADATCSNHHVQYGICTTNMYCSKDWENNLSFQETYCK